jgi:hypothetical protein
MDGHANGPYFYRNEFTGNTLVVSSMEIIEDPTNDNILWKPNITLGVDI